MRVDGPSTEVVTVMVKEWSELERRVSQRALPLQGVKSNKKAENDC